MVRRLPVRAYSITLVVAAVAFMTLAMVEERDAFFPALRLAAPPSTSRGPSPAAAEQVVREVDAAFEQAYAQGSAAPLEAAPASSSLRQALESELSNPVTRRLSLGLRLVRFAVVQVERLSDGSLELTTDETWSYPSATGMGARGRLRFRYRLSWQGEGLRVEEMTPILPEPAREPHS